MYNGYGDNMQLRYQDKIINLVDCKSFYNRFKGFMMCRNIDKALLFRKCNSIHTFFMLKNIDVLFCDDNNVILYYYRNVSPNRVKLPKRKVTRVYELPVNYFDIKVHDRLEIIK